MKHEPDQPDKVCAHCRAPIPASDEYVEEVTSWAKDGGGEPLYFCCVGCKSVYHTLDSLGLDDFYQWRDMDGDGRQSPAPSPEGWRLPPYSP